ncbi:DedA family protein [Chelatococcus asaccharovorans]|uniref:DedA family protein n=1 Tax=Chelatococcus asaccharovorans TaxID=28210 RepID=UPI00224C724E|nr:DedA family protein [Chelatococcus asaccharovorans]CAH1665110.1 Membrane protein DedA with SNARE-associated domain [Chelatococcus asaccharovorans]CAH1682120.1 Membrane protein DedA with SNARE-associated domain [Chelatococcus asaccharovorans]
MTFASITADIISFVQSHSAWAPALAFVLAFGESVVIISLFVWGTVILLAIGALIGAGGIELWPSWLAAAAGASLGNLVSFWFGRHYGERILTMWPFNRYPETMAAGQRFFERWGSWTVFLTRFSGPLHGVGALVAGMFGTPALVFHMANIASAMVWAFLVLAPAAATLRALLPS